MPVGMCVCRIGMRKPTFMHVCIGSVFVVLVAWAVIESDGWRTLTMITAVPVFVAFILGKYTYITITFCIGTNMNVYSLFLFT